METLEAIEKRRSCRKYKDEEVDKELIGVVLNAGRLAPSAGNLQDRSFIVVKNKGTRLAIAEACGGQMWMQHAPVHIVICADMKKVNKFYGVRGEKIYSIQDCSLAAQNMLLAATDLELGSCIVSAFDEEKMKRILGITEPAKPVAVITLGYCAEEPKQTPKYELEKIVFIEKYGNKIENPYITLGIWSEIIAQQVAKMKEKAKIPEKKAAINEKIKKIKEHGKKLHEKIKNIVKPKKKEKLEEFKQTRAEDDLEEF